MDYYLVENLLDKPDNSIDRHREYLQMILDVIDIPSWITIHFIATKLNDAKELSNFPKINKVLRDEKIRELISL